ncbi:tetratricopeptide repeat protein [Blattabacterium cuenoti]|uniref:tetratricopeptide repeat protein n=1 Tax=Blattabacterium cuenoti TaxID=1653831 RepID=UPI00163CF4D5|nr:tetratricopeptide repeat protein [Blattabacterium cuenoti]
MKRNHIFFSIIFIIIIVSTFIFLKKFFLYPLEEKAIKELNYAQQFLYQGDIDKALNKKNIKINYLGFSGIASKFPFYFTKAGNISKFYAGICYYKLGDYKESIKMMKSFSAKDEILSSIKYGIIGDAFTQMKNKKEALKNYVIAANMRENEITTPLYYYKAALLNFSMKNYEDSKYFLKKIENKYPFFLYKKNVEKYLMFIENKL